MDGSRLARGLLVLATLGLSMGLAAGSRSTATPAGVVVEEVEKGSAGERARVKPGDVLVSWVRFPALPANPDAAQGSFRAPSK